MLIRTLMCFLVFLFPLPLSSVSHNQSDSSDGKTRCTGDHCHVRAELDVEDGEEDEEGPCIVEYEDMTGLYRWDPVKVGYEREVKVGKRMMKMITKAVHPPIFEIPDFLTEEECNTIISDALESGMSKSFLHEEPKSVNYNKKFQGFFKGKTGVIEYFDEDGDGTVTTKEVKTFAAKYKFLYLNDADIATMIKTLELTQLDDGKITSEEWKTLPTAAVDDYLNDLRSNHPFHRDRYSEQIWIGYRGYFYDRMKEKIKDITRLPMKIIRSAEPLQVVRYGVKGHYHAHYDSMSPSKFPDYQCCQFDPSLVPRCLLCRYLTILYYLNDVEQGGETAFPVADVENFNETEFKERKEGDKYNLSKYCHESSVVVTPKKGKAILWYNHELDKDGKWLGERDVLSMHGGCDILKGHKWVANNWIPAPDKESRNRLSYFVEHDDVF